MNTGAVSPISHFGIENSLLITAQNADLGVFGGKRVFVKCRNFAVTFPVLSLLLDCQIRCSLILSTADGGRRRNGRCSNG